MSYINNIACIDKRLRQSGANPAISAIDGSECKGL
jgi:hypothetical protein